MIEAEWSADVVQDALLGIARPLSEALIDRIQHKLSGEVLQLRSGALAASILSAVENDESEVSVSVSSSGVPYAAIQEFGGKTAAHDMTAVNAKVLAFVAEGHQAFTRRVHHPGSHISARSYLGTALTEMREEIKYSFKQAILDALGQG